MPAPELKPGRDVAVIDVGSNSVRLVIYRLEGRAIWTVFNEKVLAGLGRNVRSTGRLPEAGVRDALGALRRFKAVLDAARPSEVHTAATAAVREARDGHDFVQRVAEETGLRLRIVSGETEARYSALGVTAGAPFAEGVVGDLGGSSLEFVRLRQGEPDVGISLPLGPFALGVTRNFDPAAVRALAVERLKAESVEAFRTRHFHAVGGAWRSLALIHMATVRYPLKIVHLYEISGRDAVDVARFIAKQSRASLERMEGVNRKRAETLPYAAMVMEALIERLGVERVTISAYGLREGMLLEAMAPELRARDPLVEGCAALGMRQGAADQLGAALATWLQPAFSGLDPLFDGRDNLVVAAACRLADLGARLHPDHRADLAFSQVLRAPIPGQTHPERAFLATAVHARYGGPVETPEPEVVRRLLSRERFDRARALGLAMRLGCDLSGRTASLLSESALRISDGRLCLAARPAWADMLLGEQTAKRAQALAQALDLKLEMQAETSSRAGVAARSLSVDRLT